MYRKYRFLSQRKLILFPFLTNFYYIWLSFSSFFKFFKVSENCKINLEEITYRAYPSPVLHKPLSVSAQTPLRFCTNTDKFGGT